MEGRTPNAIAIVTEDFEPTREAEALEAARVRAERLVEGGDVRHVVVFAAPAADGGPKHPRLFTVVETDDSKAAARVLDALEASSVTARIAAGAFEPLSGLPDALPGHETRGLLVGLTDCTDDARIDEFHDWYLRFHAADVLRSGKYHASRRYQRVAGDLPEYVALYETEGPEPDTFRSYLAWPERDRTPCPVVAVRHVYTFERLFSFPTVH